MSKKKTTKEDINVSEEILKEEQKSEVKEKEVKTVKTRKKPKTDNEIVEDAEIIEETAKDYSIFKDGKLMRNIPLKNSFGFDSPKVSLLRLTHPYWSKENLCECLVPWF